MLYYQPDSTLLQRAERAARALELVARVIVDLGEPEDVQYARLAQAAFLTVKTDAPISQGPIAPIPDAAGHRDGTQIQMHTF
jgi:hypothetical protein